MTGKRKQLSPLTEAAQAFDDALEAHTRATELFLRSTLSNTKQLERANELLTEIAACEEQLRERGAALSVAVVTARDRQQQEAQDVVARLPLIQERNRQLQALIESYRTLGEEVAAVTAATSTAAPGELVAPLAAMAERAAALAASAREAGFEELATQAHALHQRLAATAKKLDVARLQGN